MLTMEAACEVMPAETGQTAAARQLCSYLPQAQMPIDSLYVREAIVLTGMIRGGDGPTVRRRADALIDALDLGQWRPVLGLRLSGGVRRLVGFAMVTVWPGRVVILDEPTNDVDPLRRRLLWDQVRQLGDAGAAVALVTGAPALALIPVGIVLVPSLIGQQKTAGTFDFIWSLPVPRPVAIASTVTIFTLVAIPGTCATLLLAAWRYGITLSISASIVPAVVLTAVMAASVGMGLAHAIRSPLVTNLITNILIFVVLLFSPIAFPRSQFPDWLANVHEVLPFYHMGAVLRAGLTTGLVSDVCLSYLVLLAWTIAGWSVTAWVIGRRH